MAHSRGLLTGPIDASPAVLVKKYDITQQKDLELKLSIQQQELQRCAAPCQWRDCVIQSNMMLVSGDGTIVAAGATRAHDDVWHMLAGSPYCPQYAAVFDE